MSHKTIVKPYIIKYIPIVTLNFDKKPNLYGFDLDHTLIKPKTPNAIFSKMADDWQYMKYNENISVIQKLLEIVQNDPFTFIVIFTNQGNVLTVPKHSKSYYKFNLKINLILKDIRNREGGDKLLERLWIYSSTKKPKSMNTKTNSSISKQNKITKLTHFKNVKFCRDSNEDNRTSNVEAGNKFEEMRKPGIGLYNEFMEDLRSRMGNLSIDKDCWKWYCGDAAGRKSDFSDSDKVFSERISIPFKLPEEVFI